jgi:hypothetical protein
VDSFDDSAVRVIFQGVVESSDGGPGIGTVAPYDGPSNQLVSKGRVLGQQGTVQVGSERVSIGRAFVVIVAIIAGTHHGSTEWLAVRLKKSPTAVILESDEGDALARRVH